MDLGAIRSEIKVWERHFKSDHGRHPSVQDIKDADMASKYKLYKKLSKETQPSASTSTFTAPSSRPKDVADGVISLPPAQAKEARSNASTSASVLKSPSKRSDAVSSTAPLASYNPFSPTKSRSHSKNAIATTTTTSLNIASTSFSSSSLSRNAHAKNNNKPFATPTKKSKQTLSFRTATQPLTIYEGDGGDSEDDDDDDNPFSDVAPSLSRLSSEGPDELLETSAPSSSMVANKLPKAQEQQKSLDAPSSAVLRARKRLRGEPVSPSPNKKRARVVSQTTLAFPVLRGGSAQKKALTFSDEEQDDDDDEEEDVLAASPVKAPIGSSGKSKAFKHLFDEADVVPSRRLSSTAASKPPFPGTRNGIGSIQGGVLTKSKPKLDSLEKASDLVRTASKRPREIAVGDLGQTSTPINTSEGGGREASPEGFIPPSPPPKDATGKSNKGKAVAAGSRKKTKMASSSKGGQAKSGSPSPSESSGSEDLSVKVKLVSRRMPPSSTKHAEEGEEGGDVEEGKEGEQDIDGDDEDNRLGVSSRRGQAYHYARAHGKRTEEASTFTVSLPDRLRDVLSLEPPAALQASLTAGGMMGPQQEAWGVGDTGRGSGEEGDLSGEGRRGDDEQWEYERYEDEEWEGEGVPWEIGEL